jgi:hypothetical protein
MPADYDLGELRRMDEAAEKTSPRCDTTIYRRALGLLIYSLRTRPDIAFAVNHMARRATTCSEDDFIGLKRIARYLHGTRHKTLRFKCSSPEDRHAYTRLYAWCDASHANQQGSRSQTGTCFSLGPTGPMFYCKSTVQQTVSLSSAESETNAATDATQDIIWFREILEWLGFTQNEPTTLFSDNKSMITLATKYSGNHKRIRHFMTKVNFMIQKVEDSFIDLIHLAGEKMPADVLTKSLGPAAHERHTEQLMTGSTPDSKEINFIFSSCFSSSILRISTPDTTLFPTYTNEYPAPPRTRTVHFAQIIPLRHVQIYDIEESSKRIACYIEPRKPYPRKKNRHPKHKTKMHNI